MAAKKSVRKGGVKEEDYGLCKRTDFHLLRKIWHCSVGCLLSYVHGFVLTRQEGTMLFAFLFGLCLFLEIMRRQSGGLNHLMIKCLGPIMRQHEVNKLAGTFYYAFGLFFVTLVYPKRVACLAIIYLSVVDPIASTVGVLLPNTFRNGQGKSYLGGLVGMSACVGAGLYYLTYIFPFVEMEVLVGVAVAGGAVAAISELMVPSPPSGGFPYNTDDNFIIPFQSGLFLYGLFWYLDLLALDCPRFV